MIIVLQTNWNSCRRQIRHTQTLPKIRIVFVFFALYLGFSRLVNCWYLLCVFFRLLLSIKHTPKTTDSVNVKIMTGKFDLYKSHSLRAYPIYHAITVCVHQPVNTATMHTHTLIIYTIFKRTHTKHVEMTERQLERWWRYRRAQDKT